MRTCTACKLNLADTKFYKSKKKKLSGRCKNCKSRSNKLCALEHKIETFKAYGGCRCACNGCDVVEPRFLTIDHIGNSKKYLGHTTKKTRGRALYKTLRERGYPYKKQLRVLCFNCNCAIGSYGYCPHSKKQ